MPGSGVHIEIRGVVQGVGFRPWVYQLATAGGICGRVRNDSRGVIIDAFAAGEALRRFMARLESEAPPAARVRQIETTPIAWEDADGFAIVESEATTERQISIPPDLATCGDCLDEIFDPSNRRHLYPFTNCTNCGPRYTIVRDVPYDRDKTTMARFTMCSDCRREYEDPLDRRFHAQPNACPVCGPHLTAMTPLRQIIGADSPLQFAARSFRAQMIVAVKGLGGFHLACDATSSLAVRRLRDRKRREAKPLAVMVRDLAAAEELAELNDQERSLLTSVERPIVLVRRRKDAKLAPEVAPDTPFVGLFLPYTPLHHILLRECRHPLVMTSGNTSDEPMATGNEEALERLGDIADIFLLHDRDIETRADDSVARVVDGQPMLMRRARGYVPCGVAMPRPFAEPVLAVGAHLKNAICIGAGSAAYLGPHIGDLETFDTLRSFETSVEQLETFIGVEPRVVAHDLHPDYFSTRYAEGLSGVRLIGVQHHHAHIGSAIAEHALEGPVVGVAYDGTGFGTDGTSWGGEIMIATLAGYRRFATFRPIALAGADKAIRQVWRIALALLDDAFDNPPVDDLPLFKGIETRAIESVRMMIERGFNSPRARGIGRYFDALGAIGLAAAESRYEGDVAMRWNAVADESERGRYEVVVRDGADPWEIDARPMVRAAVTELIAGVAPSIVSARFHNTLAEVTVEVVRAACTLHGEMPVVLTGGCFQNALLAERVIGGLRSRHRTLINHQIPPGDGGLALGQAVIADAILRAGTEGIDASAGETAPATEMASCV